MSLVWAVACAGALCGCLEPMRAPGVVKNVDNLTSVPAPPDDGDQLPAYVKQCEAVLGKIPEINCDPAHPAPGTKVSKIPTFVDGTLLGFTSKMSAEELRLLADRAEAERYTCDFPSLGGLFQCSVGSTLVQYQSPDNPNVQWVGLCRGVPRDNPGYDRFIGNGLIGANYKTGEMCFFFGLNPDPEKPYSLPRLSSDAPTTEALAPWLAPTKMPGSCISCHPNNDPWIFTPWLQPSYMSSKLSDPSYPLHLPDGITLDDVMAANIIDPTPLSLQNLLPEPLPQGRSAWTEEEILDAHGVVLRRQYRIVGSSYVDNEAKGGVEPRTGIKPDSWFTNFRERIQLKPAESSCSKGCHVMGNEHWINMAHDALGTKYSLYNSSQMLETPLPGHEWMVYGAPASTPPDVDDGYTIPAITECPIPKQLIGNVEVTCGPGVVDVRFAYANDFGGVPGRDDVRFDVAALADGVEAPELGLAAGTRLEGARLEEAEGVSVVRDVAAADGANYDARFRVGAGGPHAVVLQPKRYCFEEPGRRPYAYAAPRVIDVSACH
jgi:hypothetical protein